MNTFRMRTGRLAAVAVSVAALAAGVAVGPGAAGAATGSADLGVTLSRTPNLAQGGDVVTYTATVTNSGPDASEGAVLLDPISSFGLVKGTITTTAGTCDSGSNGIVTCSLGTLAASASATVTIPVQMYRSGIVESSVAVGAVTADPNSANDQATVSLVVQPGPTYQERLATGYFKLIIGRDPTAAELDHWAERFGIDSIQQVVLGLLSTNTRRAAWVDEQFRRYLGRPAGSAATTYVKLLNQGKTYDDVTALIVSSGEFAKSVTSHCDDGLCVDFAPWAWLDKAYLAVTGDVMPYALEQQYFARYGSQRSFAIALKLIKTAQARRKFVDVTVRKWKHTPAQPFDLYVGVSDLMKGRRPDIVEAVILGAGSVYGPFVEGCCSYYPGYPIYDSHPDSATATSATTSKTATR